MLTPRERKDLTAQWSDTPAEPSTTLAKCTVGLAIIAGIALVGFFTEPPAPPPMQSMSAKVGADQTARRQAAAQNREVEAASERRLAKRAQEPDPRSLGD